MRPLLDLNVLLDHFLQRPQWVAEATAIWQAHQARRITGLIAASAFPALFYLAERYGSTVTAFQAVRSCLDDLTVVPVTQQTLELAYMQTGIDFEDNVQLACAIEANADVIVTRDLAGFAGSPIPVLDPAAFVARLAAPPPSP